MVGTDETLRVMVGLVTRGKLDLEALRKARADVGDAPRQGGKHSSKMEGPVCVIKVQGPLCRHADMLDDISGATSYGALRRQLQEAMSNPACTAVLLKVDSPGGEANGCGDLAAQIRGWDAQKPILAYAEGMCTSAAYYLSSACRAVLCGPGAQLGSIGVRMALIDDSKAQENAGIQEIEIVSSQSPDKRSTPIDGDLRALAQQRCDDMGALFISDVARYRGVATAKVEKDFGRGYYMIASKAVKCGLADDITDYAGALAQARAAGEKAAAKKTPPPAQPAARSKTMDKTLAERLSALANAESMSAEDLRGELAALVPAAKKVEKDHAQAVADLTTARARVIELGTKADGAEYERLIGAAMSTSDNLAGQPNPHARKITSPAMAQRVRDNCPDLGSLQRYLAIAEPAQKAPAITPPTGPGSKADDDRRNAGGGTASSAARLAQIEAALDAPQGVR
jgi:ClpP class serine protease